MIDRVSSTERTTPGVWRRVGPLALWSVASGVALGVAVRLAMRFVALEACVPQGFSVGGSLEVVAAATLIGAPLAAAFLAVPVRLTASSRCPGLLWGLAVFALLALLPSPTAQSALAATPDTPAATAAAFALCFVAWGLTLDRIPRLGATARHPLSAR